MSDRFKVTIREYGDGWYCVLVDSATGRELGTDGGPIEDQTLLRDLKWVPDELNALAAENTALKDLLREAREECRACEIDGSCQTCRKIYETLRVKP